jgi:hypothetical protein
LLDQGKIVRKWLSTAGWLLESIMFLTQLVYVSEAKPGLHLNDIRSILSAAKRHNEAFGITGALFFNHKHFIQCLEGGRSEVNSMYHKIVKDERHTNPQIFLLRDITKRSFADWTIGFASHTEMHKALFLKYNSSATFDPTVMFGQSALDFLISASEAFETV